MKHEVVVEVPGTEKLLPEKLSDCILLALEDLQKCEVDPRYKIWMSAWHEPHERCYVCLAGSVMAQTLNANLFESLGPANYSKHNNKRLMALNSIRAGHVRTAMSYMGIIPGWDAMQDVDVSPYHHSPTAFTRDLTKIAMNLKELGY
jgi:hypothetical protein